MATAAYRNEVVVAPRTNWGAIWAGMFSFAAIWSVFGTLGEAIFASSATARAAHPIAGMSAGEGIWIVVLTIIALYVGGRITGVLARVANRGEAAIYGSIMYGLSFVATLLLIVIGGTALNGGAGVAAGAHSSYMLTVFADLGWIGFASLFLGWLAAMGGAAHVVKQERPAANVRDIRPAA
ncbi:MAG: hypothetical protein WA252_20515 [Candidatus Sulfotelmatobacter sp.]